MAVTQFLSSSYTSDVKHSKLQNYRIKINTRNQKMRLPQLSADKHSQVLVHLKLDSPITKDQQQSQIESKLFQKLHQSSKFKRFDFQPQTMIAPQNSQKLQDERRKKKLRLNKMPVILNQKIRVKTIKQINDVLTSISLYR